MLENPSNPACASHRRPHSLSSCWFGRDPLYLGWILKGMFTWIHCHWTRKGLSGIMGDLHWLCPFLSKCHPVFTPPYWWRDLSLIIFWRISSEPIFAWFSGLESSLACSPQGPSCLLCYCYSTSHSGCYCYSTSPSSWYCGQSWAGQQSGLGSLYFPQTAHTQIGVLCTHNPPPLIPLSLTIYPSCLWFDKQNFMHFVK